MYIKYSNATWPSKAEQSKVEKLSLVFVVIVVAVTMHPNDVRTHQSFKKIAFSCITH